MSAVLSPQLTSTESRALSLLGQGFAPSMVATAVGVSDSRISQLLSNDQFASQVAELRYRQLAAHTERDNKYDTLEDQLLDRLSKSLSMIFDPMKLAKILQTINSAKRRGAAAPEHLTTQQTVVQLNMPTQVIQQFIINSANQVIKAGAQELITVQSGNMSKLLAERLPELLVAAPSHTIQSDRNEKDTNHVPSPFPRAPEALSSADF